MSHILVQMLVERFEPDERSPEQIFIYPYGQEEEKTKIKYIERIEISLYNEKFEGRRFKADDDKIQSTAERLAGEIFDDVNHSLNKNMEYIHIIEFLPVKPDEYNQKYTGHYISIKTYSNRLRIDIFTGSRGDMQLNDKQRQKYFDYVVDLYTSINPI